jgi:hypothetical protein
MPIIPMYPGDPPQTLIFEGLTPSGQAGLPAGGPHVTSSRPDVLAVISVEYIAPTQTDPRRGRYAVVVGVVPKKAELSEMVSVVVTAKCDAAPGAPYAPFSVDATVPVGPAPVATTGRWV